MARPEKNDVDYFPFYCKEGASTNYIDEKYGNNGFAVWVKLLRLLAKTDFHYLDLSKKKTVMLVSSKCKVDEGFLINFLHDLAELEEIDKQLLENNIVYSDKFVESIGDAYKKRNNDLMKKEEFIHMLVGLGVLNEDKIHNFTEKVGDNTHIIVKETIVKETILEQSKKKDIDSRKLEFSETLKPFIEVYGREMCLDFYYYWTEENKSKSKLRYELQKTWNLSGRLRTWAKNDKNFKQNGKTSTTNYHSTKASTHELLTETLRKYNGDNV